jgi:hypothetical protein
MFTSNTFSALGGSLSPVSFMHTSSSSWLIFVMKLSICFRQGMYSVTRVLEGLGTFSLYPLFSNIKALF